VAGDDDGARVILGRSSDVSMGASGCVAVFIEPSRRRHRRSGNKALQAEFAEVILRQCHVWDFMMRVSREHLKGHFQVGRRYADLSQQRG
jgi:hypothetical protein